MCAAVVVKSIQTSGGIIVYSRAEVSTTVGGYSQRLFK